MSQDTWYVLTGMLCIIYGARGSGHYRDYTYKTLEINTLHDFWVTTRSNYILLHLGWMVKWMDGW